ncbi:MAG: dTMP kinase [Armatimonadota bacterium]
MRGKFITFEGTEGAGKTTQVKLLSRYLKSRGCKVLISREPGGTRIGEAVREILADKKNKKMHPLTEFLLFSASRAQHIKELIEPYLKKGYIVISDRFSDASFAYQGSGRGLDISLIKKNN